MRNSLFFRWLIAAFGLAFLSHLLLPRKREIRTAGDDTATRVRLPFIGLDEFYDPSLDISRTTEIETFQTADAFLPYFALLPTLPDLAAADVVGT